VWKFNASTSRLDRISSAPVGDPYGPDALHGFGACGIAIADLNETGVTNPTPVILVTTLNGEFVVFAQSSGVLTPTPLYRTVVEGQLGAFNSIVVSNLDIAHFGNKPEIYIASSLGVRKFYVQKSDSIRHA
jgi:hypothetical protein